MLESNPCIECGACCAGFRVSFYWAEADAAAGGVTPAHLTVAISPHRVAMRGTDQPNPRCIALQGEPGKQVWCNIYGQRPSPCRDFAASWENDEPNPRCDQIRAHYSMPPLISKHDKFPIDLLTNNGETCNLSQEA